MGLFDRLSKKKAAAPQASADPTVNSSPPLATADQVRSLAARAGMPDAEAGEFAAECVERKLTLADASSELIAAMKDEHAAAVRALDDAKNLAATNAGKAAEAEKTALAKAEAAEKLAAELKDTKAKIGDKGRGLSPEDAPTSGALGGGGGKTAAFVKPHERGSVMDRFAPGLAANLALVTGDGRQGKLDLESGKIAVSDPRERFSAVNAGGSKLTRFEPAGPLAGAAPETYMDAVNAYRAGGISPAQAFRAAAVNYPKLHRAWRAAAVAKAREERDTGADAGE